MASMIKLERVKIGLSQTEMAQRLGISLSYYRRIEKDIDCCPVGKIKEMADIFNCSADKLMAEVK